MSFVLYLIGFIVFIAGVVWALVIAGISTLYISIGAVILAGLAIVSGGSRTRHKDPPL